MRIEQLRYLEAALQYGSLRRAADALGLAQPSIGAQIRRLEEDLGVVLLLRGAYGVRLTPAGEIILPRVRAALRAQEALRQEASALTGLRSGHIRLASISPPAHSLLPQAVSEFRRKFPNIHFQVTEIGSPVIREGVLSGDYDIGILARLDGMEEEPDALRYIDLTVGQVVLQVPDGHRLAGCTAIKRQDLAGESMVRFGTGSLIDQIYENLVRDLVIYPVFFTNNAATSRRMVQAGVGLALAHTIDPDTYTGNGVTVVPIDEPGVKVRMSIALRQDEQPAPATRELLKILRRINDN